MERTAHIFLVEDPYMDRTLHIFLVEVYELKAQTYLPKPNTYILVTQSQNLCRRTQHHSYIQ